MSPIVVYEKTGKRSEKKIFSIKHKKNSENLFTLILKAEGGLPIKRFVEGNDVSPNVSQTLDIHCKCQEFDFHGIQVQ